jgi:hypothetical protein
MNAGIGEESRARKGVLTTVFPLRVFAKQPFARYNTTLTTKRAGTNRPFFLVERFWSSKLSERVSGGYRVFCFGHTQTGAQKSASLERAIGLILICVCRIVFPGLN